MNNIYYKLKLHKIAVLFITAALILWCSAGAWMNVLAAEETGSMTLWCVKDDDIVVGMHWQLYRVGHRESNDYVFEGDFEKYRPTLGDRTKPMLKWDAETVACATEALKRMTIVNQTAKRAEGFTNSSGSVTFSDLENGLYLVWGDILTVGDITYVPSAIFFEMNGEEASILNAYPKIIQSSLSSSHGWYSCRKVWENDEDQPWNRSVSITVARYRDNVYYDEIELREENDWTYEWEDTTDHIWFVYEISIPDGYTVSYRDNDMQYLIINTFEGESGTGTSDTQTTTTDSTTDETQTTSETDSDTTSSTNQTTTDHTTTTTYSATTTSTSDTTITTEKVPQTGQLWWPVPALAAGGLLFFGIGVSIRRKNDEEEN